eukprot:1357455-Prymnesium_polylepis.1
MVRSPEVPTDVSLKLNALRREACSVVSPVPSACLVNATKAGADTYGSVPSYRAWPVAASSLCGDQPTCTLCNWDL